MVPAISYYCKEVGIAEEIQGEPRNAETNRSAHKNTLDKIIINKKGFEAANTINGNLIENVINQVIQGKNAFLVAGIKHAIASKQKASLILHEIGHMVNYNIIGNKASKYLYLHSFTPKITVPVVLITSLIHKSNENNQNKLTFIKIKDFIKDHCAGLSFLSFCTILADEGRASLLALNHVKKSKLLTNQMYKGFRKNLLVGFISYLGLALATAGAVKTGSVISNKISKKI